MAAKSQHGQVIWDLINSDGPTVVYAAGCSISGSIYIHGGVSDPRSTKPLSTLYRYDVGGNSWELIDLTGPSLSHHSAASMDEKHIALIGGWTGKERTSNVFLFDVSANVWISVETTGFPAGAGLSSHTVSMLTNSEMLVIGREGSLRTQRRSGNAFILSGSISKKKFRYKASGMSVASRSGHTTTIYNSTALIIGGRNDKLFELHKVSPTPSTTLNPLPQIKQLASEAQNLTKLPGGRKNHSGVVLDDYVFIFGGETFDGRSKEPVAEAYLIDCNTSYAWKSIGKLNIGRAGHVCTVTGEGVILHGGSGEGNKTCNQTFRLTFST